MTVKTIRTALVLVVLGLSFGSSAQATIINLVSGQTTGGGTDSSVTFAPGPASGDFTTLPFGSATTPAYVVTPNPVWVGGSLSSVPLPSLAGTTAAWDSVSPTGNVDGTTALYAITFSLATSTTGGSITLNYATDDVLAGVYLDGTQLSGTLPGTFNAINTATLSFGALTAGTHTLYFDDVNLPGFSPNPAGILFTAVINTVPEPSSIAMVAIAGVMGLVGFRARRNRSIA